MKTSHYFALFCSIALSPAAATESARAVMAAKTIEPMVQWQEHSVLRGDLTCRGRQELAIMGTLDSVIKVAVFINGTTKRPVVLEIASDLLAVQTTMSTESQDFDTGTGDPGDVGPLPGFKRSRTCLGLRLDDDRIDSVHIYWNRLGGRFQSWQR